MVPHSRVERLHRMLSNVVDRMAVLPPPYRLLNATASWIGFRPADEEGGR